MLHIWRVALKNWISTVVVNNSLSYIGYIIMLWKFWLASSLNWLLFLVTDVLIYSKQKL